MMRSFLTQGRRSSVASRRHFSTNGLTENEMKKLKRARFWYKVMISTPTFHHSTWFCFGMLAFGAHDGYRCDKINKKYMGESYIPHWRQLMDGVTSFPALVSKRFSEKWE